MDLQNIQVKIESIDAEGKGIARLNGKTIFVENALPNEIVTINIYRKKPKFDLAKIVEINEASKNRVIPKCEYFGVCGGCSLQHINFYEQVISKEKVLLDNLKHIGKIEPKKILPPLIGKPWEYRHRARLSAKYVFKKGEVLVGFREKSSPYVVNMDSCLILPKHISDLIPKLRVLIDKLSIKDKIPQIEVAVGENISVFLMRIMSALNISDEELIKNFIDENSTFESKLQMWLQPSGINSYEPFYPKEMPQLSYSLKDFAINMPYYPTEFTQVNPEINNEMVKQAITLLDIQENDTIIDFFCGIGNFTLPIAKMAKNTLGIEGNEQLIIRARKNASHNNLDNKVNFMVQNLFKVDKDWLIKLGKFDKWLLDPSRDGAHELIKSITPKIMPKIIVYVSCNTATLARDAEILTAIHGYTLNYAGVMNMFPHTSHIESIAVFSL
ncbi:MAG TPA: 23S rRNA (uracil(1939)-C(5))-methyltransferase RlmD [Burkholderiales bacterium]|nr:23S rRNA (uracil(1939)-C(5))-methyltransferase RlmD [Burkholderiales bacterium]